MVEKIIRYSLDNRLIVIVFFLLVAVWGVWALSRTPVDAIPDLSDNQVIVMVDWMGRAPQIVQDQITYPLTTTFQGLPHVKAVRSQTMFGLSMIYIIFKDDVDVYWARSRVLEKLATVSGLPSDAKVVLGPDGTGVGHVYWYTVEGRGYDLGELRAVQDWYLRYALNTVPGVAEVASIGGFVKQYQIELDPTRMASLNVSTMDVMEAVKRSNVDVGGGLIERGSMEYLIRGLGYVKTRGDLENVVIRASETGIPVYLKDVANLQMGGEIRRGLLDKNGEGEVVGGIIVMRYGENAKAVIGRVKEKIKELSRGLPPGVEVKMAYDRSDLIKAAVHTLEKALKEEMLIVSIVIFLFLLHFRSSLVVILTLPLAVLISFIIMYHFRVTSNIMSLGGIAIAIGALVDAGIVVVENAYRHLSEGTDEDRKNIVETVYRACKTVGRPIFFSVLIIVLSFLPVFLLTGQEGKLFFPLAMTKTGAMAAGAILAITIVPVLATFFLRGKLRPESQNPISTFLIRAYRPLLNFALNHKRAVLVASALILVGTGLLAMSIGREFMPALDEGSLLFMPTTLPNASITEVKRIVQVQDKIIKSLPEVKLVLGKVGRAETATDPAPVSMIETIILLKPKSQWRKGMTREDIIAELDRKLQIPGVTNGWTQPIINRINMLATGVRTDLGVKIYGEDLGMLEHLAVTSEEILRNVRGAADLFAERNLGGNYIDIDVDREAIARYGLRVQDVTDVIEMASGGMNVTTTVEGKERFPVRVRYAREFRDSPEKLKRILVMTPSGAQIPLEQVARVMERPGPAMIATEHSLPRSIVFLNVRGRDMGSFVEEAKAALDKKLKLPPGYYIEWSGQWENQIRAKRSLLIMMPLVLVMIFILLYFVYHSASEAAIVMLSVPFALTGGVVFMKLLGYNWSVAVWVGFIALFGVAVETGVVMTVYLHEALERRLRQRPAGSEQIGIPELYDAIREGSVLRLRPKLMTVATTLLGLVPVMWATGTGADVMKPIAAPLLGGLLTSAAHVLLVTPVIFALTKEREVRRGTLKVSKISLGE
ncbi:MAG: CusA/CzcA family heavy metal efflux RND transporter [Candidatus Eisenbacteria bacterium]|nr:CusA/CzcA family heavy metal efflux RND transporter [Candidatus Eisenbacteria bacterium]